jgi:hypothetical protein
MGAAWPSGEREDGERLQPKAAGVAGGHSPLGGRQLARCLSVGMHGAGRCRRAAQDDALK